MDRRTMYSRARRKLFHPASDRLKRQEYRKKPRYKPRNLPKEQLLPDESPRYDN